MSKLIINNQNTNDLDNCDYLSITKLKIEKLNTNNINLQIYKYYVYIIIK